VVADHRGRRGSFLVLRVECMAGVAFPSPRTAFEYCNEICGLVD